MNKSYQLTDAEMARIATAFHEAGHAAAAVVLGGRVHRSVLADTPRTEHDRLPASTEASVTSLSRW
jgi:hypothetical protein